MDPTGSAECAAGVATACVDVPALPLQMLQRRMAEAGDEWRDKPIAVVDQDKPQGEILFVNEVAHQGRILPGMRYAAALSLDADLRAGVISEEPNAFSKRAGDEVTGCRKVLCHFSTSVVPSNAPSCSMGAAAWSTSSAAPPEPSSCTTAPSPTGISSIARVLSPGLRGDSTSF